MTNYLADTTHFSPFNEIAQVDEGAPLSSALKTVSMKGSSGILVFSRDRPRYFIDGNKLATCVVKEGRIDEGVYDKTISFFLKLNIAEVEPVPFSEIVANEQTNEGQIPLGVLSQPLAIYRVQLSGQEVGVLFSHETFKVSASTPPLKYICENPSRTTIPITVTAASARIS